jgi:HK97 family phage major capsid protein
MTLKELKEKYAGLTAQAKAIVDKADTEKREITDEEARQVDALFAEQTALQAQIKTAEANEQRRARISADAAHLAQPAGRRTAPEAPAADRAVSSGQRDNLIDDPQHGFRSIGEFCRTVRNGSHPGFSDERLLKIGAAYGQTSESGEEGGFLIPPEFSNRIVERMGTELPILDQCDRLTIGGNSITINGMADHDASSTTYRYGGVVVYWVGEGDQITRSNLKFRQVNLNLHKLAALAYCTDEELEDTNYSLGTRLLDKFGMAIGDETVEAVMHGTGVGKPLGAFASDACVSVSGETDQAADTIVAENIINLNSVIWSRSRGAGNWYYNGECLPQLETMALNVGTGGIAAYWPAGGLSSASPASIKGRPAYETDHMAALGDAGDIGFADWSQYFLATRGTPQMAMSIHLRFDYAETAFRATWRVDGRPAWETTLKPRKSASTRRVSPFVKMAARA